MIDVDGSKVDSPCLAASTSTENAPPIQIVPLTLQADVPESL